MNTYTLKIFFNVAVFLNLLCPSFCYSDPFGEQVTGTHHFNLKRNGICVFFDQGDVNVKKIRANKLKGMLPKKGFREIIWRDFENNRCYHRTRIGERAHSKTHGGLFFTTEYNIDGIKSEERIRTSAGKISKLEQDLTKLRKFHSGENGRVFF
jgi:hypothetical protein